MPLDYDLKVLIVDDMPTMRRIVRDMLEEMGFHRIIEAEDGDVAWQLIRELASKPMERVGLVLADWNMPGISGAELLRMIRADHSTQGLPFLMITGRREEGRKIEAFQAGVTQFINKPFAGPDLVARISEIFSA